MSFLRRYSELALSAVKNPLAVTASTTVRLTVTVNDRPGNVTTHLVEETV